MTDTRTPANPLPPEILEGDSDETEATDLKDGSITPLELRPDKRPV